MTMPSYSLLDAATTGPATTPPRRVSNQATGIKVTMTGPDFVVLLQISNAAAPNHIAEHLFVPREEDWETHSTVTPGVPPTDMLGAVRWVRLKILQGTVDAAHISESHTHGGLYVTEASMGDVEAAAQAAAAPALEAAKAAPTTVASLDALRTYSGEALSVVVSHPEQGGVYVRDAGVQTDDGYTQVLGEAGGWRKLGVVSIGTFHEDGDADWTGAFTRAINYANSKGGAVVVTIPARAEPYWVSAQLPPILVDFVFFLGEGKRASYIGHDYAGTLIQYGRPSGGAEPAVFATGGGVLACGVQYRPYTRTVIERPINPHPTVKRTVARPGYQQPIPDDRFQWLAFHVANGLGQDFDVYFAGGYSLIRFGSPNDTGWASMTRIIASGYARNVGVPLQIITAGSTYQFDIRMTLDVEPPIKEKRYKDPVAKTGEYLHIEPGMAYPGGTWLLFDGLGTTDTIEGISVSMAQNWHKKVEVKTGAGRYTMNTDLGKIVGDNTTSTGIDINPAAGGVISRFVAAYGYDQSWGDVGIIIRGQGICDLLDFSHSRIFNTAYSGFVWLNPNARNVCLDSMEVFSTNMEQVRSGSANAPAMAIGDGCNSWSGANMRINKSRADLGDTYSADIGLEIGECEDYVLDGTMAYGRQSGFRYKRKKADGSPVRASRRRSYRGGIIENWHQHERLLETLDSTDFDLKSGSIWRNNTPFIVTVSVGGGTVQNITRGSGYEGEAGYNGYGTGRTDGEFTLNPGEWIQIFYSETPTININAVR